MMFDQNLANAMCRGVLAHSTSNDSFADAVEFHGGDSQ
jgi:hypothetical protein